MNKNIIDLFADFIKDKPGYQLHVTINDTEEAQFDITIAASEYEITVDLIDNIVYIYYHGNTPEKDNNDISQQLGTKYSELMNIITNYMNTININQFMCFYSSIYFSGEKQFLIKTK